MDDLATPTPHAAVAGASIPVPLGVRGGPHPRRHATRPRRRPRPARRRPRDLRRRRLHPESIRRRPDRSLPASPRRPRAQAEPCSSTRAAPLQRPVHAASRTRTGLAGGGRHADVPPEAVSNSTGVIGEHLLIDDPLAGIATLEAELHQDAVDSFARAIMTTDLPRRRCDNSSPPMAERS